MRSWEFLILDTRTDGDAKVSDSSGTKPTPYLFGGSALDTVKK
jgi:hypothetical protein